MLPAMGPMMLIATLEDTIQQLLRDKLALQTELELLTAGFATPASQYGCHQQQPQQQTDDSAPAGPSLDISSSFSTGAATAEAGGMVSCSAASFLELQQLVQHLQHENAATKASLAELLQADDQEFARLHALLADQTVVRLQGTTADSWLSASLPRQHDADNRAPNAAAAAGAEASALQLFDLRGVDNADRPAAPILDASTLSDRDAVEGVTAVTHPQLATGEGGALQQGHHAPQQLGESVTASVGTAGHQSSSSGSSRQLMLALIHQQQLMLTQLQRVCQQKQQQETSGSDLVAGSSEPHQLLHQAQQQAGVLACTLSDIRHAVAISPGSILPDAAAFCAAAAAAAGRDDRVDMPAGHPQQQRVSEQQQPAAAPLQLEELPAVNVQRDTAAAAAGPSSTQAAGEPAAAIQVDTIDLRNLQQLGHEQQQQQQVAAEIDSDELDALLADADQQQLLPAAVQFDPAGNLISPAAAATAAAAIAAVQHQQQQQQQQQQHCCAFCGEQFPCAAAFWAHCVMPHHVLLLLVRQQQLQGTGLLGMQALPGWWRRSLLLPQDTAAAAAGGGGSSSKGPTTTFSSDSRQQQHQQQQQSTVDSAALGAGLTCCAEHITQELQMMKHYLSSGHLNNVAAAVAAASDQTGGGSSSNSRFTSACCEHIRQLASALLALSTAAQAAAAARQALIKQHTSPVAAAAAGATAEGGKKKQALAAGSSQERERHQQHQHQQQQQDPVLQNSAHECLLALESYTSAAESYLSGFETLRTSGLLPVPVPQGAAQALDLLLQCYKQQLTLCVTDRVTDLQPATQMPEPGPAMRVWMNPGVYVLPVELLLLLEHEPAAAAAASVMLGVQQVLLPQQQQQGPQQQQQSLQQSRAPPSKEDGTSRKEIVAVASVASKVPHRAAAAAAAANQSGVAAEPRKQSTKSNKRRLDQPSVIAADQATPLDSAAVAGGGLDTTAAAAAAANEKANKRRKHEPIPRPPPLQTTPAAAAAAGGTGGSAGSSPSAAAAAGTSAGGSGSGAPGRHAKRTSPGSGFVQLGNKIPTSSSAAARSRSPSSSGWQQQQQGSGSSRATLPGSTATAAGSTDPGASLPPPMLSMMTPGLGRSRSGRGQPSVGSMPSGGMPSGGYMGRAPPAPGFFQPVAPDVSGWGFAGPPLQQYDDLYAEQAADFYYYGPGNPDYYADDLMVVQQHGGRGDSAWGLRGGFHHQHLVRGGRMSGFHGRRSSGRW